MGQHKMVYTFRICANTSKNVTSGDRDLGLSLPALPYLCMREAKALPLVADVMINVEVC